MRNILYNYVGRFGSQFITLLIAVYVIRELSVEVYGQYSILQSILAYTLIITSFGLINVFQRYIPEFQSKNQAQNIVRFVGIGLGIRLLVSVFAVVGVLLLANPLGHLLGIPNLIEYLEIYGLTIVLTSVALLLDAVLTSLLLQFAANLSLLISSVIRGLGFYYVLSQQYGLKGLLVAEAIAVFSRMLILMLAYLFWMWRIRRGVSISRVSNEIDWKRIGKYGGWAYLNELGYLFFNTDTDNFIIGNQLGDEAVGRYSFANKIGGMINQWSPVTVASNVITPLFFQRYVSQYDTAELNRMFGMLNKLIYLFWMPILAGIVALNVEFVELLFGEKYVASTWILVGVIAYNAFNGYQYPLGLVVFALEENQINFYSRIFAFYNLIAGLLLVRLWGIPGILFATGTAVTLKNLFIYFLIRKQVYLSWDWWFYSKLLGVAVVMSVVVWSAMYVLTGAVGLIMAICVGWIVYLVLIFVSRIISSEELLMVNQIFGRKIIPNWMM